MTHRAGRRRLRRLALACVVSSAMAGLGGCGGPEYTYVTNSADRTYLKVPTTWQPIDSAELGQALGLDPSLDQRRQGFWLAGYDADAAPSTDHLFGPHSAAPAAFVAVREVPPAARGQISLDLMRDLFRPVSAKARQRDATNPISPFSGFGLMTDEVLTPDHGLRGVHSVYRYRINGGPSQVFDQTVYVNDDASKIYMFYVRCSMECYEERQQEIASVASSFTVRENP